MNELRILVDMTDTKDRRRRVSTFRITAAVCAIASMGAAASFEWSLGTSLRRSVAAYECVPAGKIGQKGFEEVMQTVAEGWNTGNAKLAASCFAEDAIYSGPPSPGHRGRTELYKFFGGDRGVTLPFT